MRRSGHEEVERRIGRDLAAGRHSRRLLLGLHADDPLERAVGKRQLAGERTEDDHPDGVQIGGRRHVARPAKLLRRHVAEAADDVRRRRQRVGDVGHLAQPSDAEIDQLDGDLLVAAGGGDLRPGEEHVARLDIPVNDAHGVNVTHADEELLDPGDELLRGGEFLALEELVERLAHQPFEDEERIVLVVAVPEDAPDVRAGDLGQEESLAREPFPVLRRAGGGRPRASSPRLSGPSVDAELRKPARSSQRRSWRRDENPGAATDRAPFPSS